MLEHKIIFSLHVPNGKNWNIEIESNFKSIIIKVISIFLNVKIIECGMWLHFDNYDIMGSFQN